MAHAYTPGLAVSPGTEIHKRRILPLKGEVVVAPGDSIEPDTVVARSFLPGNVSVKNVAGELSLNPSDIASAMVVQEGEAVEKNDLIAEHRSFFGLFRSKCHSPVKGTIENVSPVTGQVILREPPIPVEVHGYVQGVVDEVVPEEGIVARTFGAFVQGIFGIGGETHGELHMRTEGPGAILDAGDIDERARGRVLVGGSLVTLEAFRKAAEVGARGIVVGGFNDHDLKSILGKDLGVAITGNENVGLTLVVTEGFGPIPMAKGTFELLRSLEGKSASINGATQIRAGVLRPEIIVPLEEKAGAHSKGRGPEGMLEIGRAVRVIRQPHFGEIGTVAALPSDPVRVECETKVRVLEIEFANGEKVTLPRANVELIEG